MKASYILALFAVFAVSASAQGIKDSKVQGQSADNAGAKIADNSGNLVGANNAVAEGVDVLSSHEQFIQNNQGQRQ